MDLFRGNLNFKMSNISEAISILKKITLLSAAGGWVWPTQSYFRHHFMLLSRPETNLKRRYIIYKNLLLTINYEIEVNFCISNFLLDQRSKKNIEFETFNFDVIDHFIKTRFAHLAERPKSGVIYFFLFPATMSRVVPVIPCVIPH